MKKLIVFIYIFILSLSACFADSIKSFPKEPDFVFSFDSEWTKNSFFFGTESDKFISTIKNILKEKYSIDFDKDVNRIVFFKQNDEVLLSLSGKNASKFIFSFTNKNIKPVDNNAFVETPKELNSLIEKGKNFIYIGGKSLLDFAGEIIDSITGTRSMARMIKELKKIPPEAKEGNSIFALIDGITSLIAYFEEEFVQVEIKCSDSDLSEQLMAYIEGARKLYSGSLEKHIETYQEKLKNCNFADFAMISLALYSHTKAKNFIDSIELSLGEEDGSVVFIKSNFDIAYITRSVTSIKLSMDLGSDKFEDFESTKDKKNKLICFNGQRYLKDMIDNNYNFSMYHKEGKMTSLDEKKLLDFIESKGWHPLGMPYYKKAKAIPGCEFYSVGDLTKDGYIACKVHGSYKEPSKPVADSSSNSSSSNTTSTSSNSSTISATSVEKESSKNKQEGENKKTVSPGSSFKPVTLESWVLKDLNLEMLKCPAGTFMMGIPYDEVGCGEDGSIYKYETYHPVTISKFFYIGKYEVTQSQYEKIMGNNPSVYKDAQMPVGYMTWKDAKTFCDTLNTKYSNQLPEGYRFDLPTEAQWEYACRAGTTTGLNNGTNIENTSFKSSNLDEIAWYDGNSNGTTHKVGQKKPNAWGIYDMHGNVQEWCRDSGAGKSPETEEIDPFFFEEESFYHVYRGGSYDDFPYLCLSGRHKFSNDNGWGRGFRVAIVSDESVTSSSRLKVNYARKIEFGKIPISSSETTINTLTLSDIGNDFILKMVECPAGSFIMGSPENEMGRGDTEKQHKVTFPKPFYIGKYEVTKYQYAIITKKHPSKNIYMHYSNPVDSVTWEEANKFCEILNKKYKDILPNGYIFDLPNESEWEYACRAGTKTSLNSSKDITSKLESCPNLDEVGWYAQNTDDETQPIGQKKPNAWGIYDMHGNVEEWCRNFYDDYSDKDVVNTYEKKQNTKGRHVQRGGGYLSFAMHCRSARRHEEGALSTDSGFRVALVWDGKTPISDSSSNGSIKEATKAETSSSNSSSTTQQKNSARYDTKEYKPIKLKPFKTHPKVVVPEELELEP